LPDKLAVNLSGARAESSKHVTVGPGIEFSGQDGGGEWGLIYTFNVAAGAM